MKKKVNLGTTIMLMAMSAAVAVTVTAVVVMRIANVGFSDFSKRAAQYAKLANIDSIVRANYIGTIDDTELTDELLTGYMKGIGDKYGAYLDADLTKQLTLDNEGKSVGIGVSVVKTDDGEIKVVSVTDGSPAKKAGIEPGDLITAVDGKNVADEGYTASINALRGEAGTDVAVTLSRGGTQSKLTITRTEYTTATVTSRTIGDVGYVRITEFDANTATQFSDQVDALTKSGVKALVFDVRNDPGGLLDAVEKMLDKLLPAGPVVRQKDKSGKITTIYTSDASEVKLPMAVITNGSTASAAELFTAALKDYGKAKSVGDTTYGKGTMQRIFDLGDGTSLDLSVAYFYPPKSDNFEGKGVTPDIPVTLSDAKTARFYELSDDEDDQLQAALDYVNGQIK